MKFDDISRKHFFPRVLICQVCDAPMTCHNKEKFFNCDYCGTETYPFYKNTSEQKAIREEFEKQLLCERNIDASKGMIDVKSEVNSGSISKSNKNKKQLMQKPSSLAIYEELAALPVS
jgi:hypothetical protein